MQERKKSKNKNEVAKADDKFQNGMPLKNQFYV